MLDSDHPIEPGDWFCKYNVLSVNPDKILSSKTELSNVTGCMATVQLGSDNKIYVSRYQSDYLAVIKNPDVQGAGCNLSLMDCILVAKSVWLG